MKTIRYLPFLMLVFLTACGGKPILTEGETVQDRARETLARVEVGLKLAYQQVNAEATAGVFTKAELTRAKENLDKAGVRLDQAQDMRRKGLFAESLKEAISSESLLTGVQGLLAERIKKQRGTQ